MPSVGWLLGSLPNDGAGNSPTPFTAQEFTLPLALRLGSAAGTPPCPTPTRRAWAACSGDALVGSPPRARTAPHVFLGARCQQRCGTSHGTGNARTHLGWRSGKRRGAMILAPTSACRKARRSQRYGSARLSSLRERVCMADHTRASLACVSAASEPSTSMDCTRPLGMA